MAVNEHTEEDYESILIVRLKGHGSREHQRKQAATVKRILEVKTHSKPDVMIVEPQGEFVLTFTCNEVTWDALEGVGG